MNKELRSIKTSNQWIHFYESTCGKQGECLSYGGSRQYELYEQPWILVTYPYESWGCIMSSDLYLFPDEFPDNGDRQERLDELIKELAERLETKAEHTVEYMNEHPEDYEGAHFVAGELEPWEERRSTRVILDISILSDKEDGSFDEQCYLIIDCSSEKLADYIREYV